MINKFTNWHISHDKVYLIDEIGEKYTLTPEEFLSVFNSVHFTVEKKIKNYHLKIDKSGTAKTYGSFKAEDRTQELELIAFTRTTGENIGELLKEYDEEHGTKLEAEYNKVMWGEE